MAKPYNAVSNPKMILALEMSDGPRKISKRS
jgi:hypothetical protein